MIPAGGPLSGRLPIPNDFTMLVISIGSAVYDVCMHPESRGLGPEKSVGLDHSNECWIVNRDAPSPCLIRRA